MAEIYIYYGTDRSLMKCIEKTLYPKDKLSRSKMTRCDLIQLLRAALPKDVYFDSSEFITPCRVYDVNWDDNRKRGRGIICGNGAISEATIEALYVNMSRIEDITYEEDTRHDRRIVMAFKDRMIINEHGKMDNVTIDLHIFDYKEAIDDFIDHLSDINKLKLKLRMEF